MSAGGASALNEYLERDKDALMNRTRKRPLVSGALGSAPWVPALGIGMILAPSLILLPFNPMLALFLFLGAFIYVVIYTIWLKPRTVLNIVIGGAAGSCAVLSGSAAINGGAAWADAGALLLALLVFLWTPIHFWSLALVYREDYPRAGVPMLPVRATPRRAAFWGLVHGVGAGIERVGAGRRIGAGPGLPGAGGREHGGAMGIGDCVGARSVQAARPTPVPCVEFLSVDCVGGGVCGGAGLKPAAACQALAKCLARGDFHLPPPRHSYRPTVSPLTTSGPGKSFAATYGAITTFRPIVVPGGMATRLPTTVMPVLRRSGHFRFGVLMSPAPTGRPRRPPRVCQ